MKEEKALLILQNWFTNNCNGDWEHEFGVQIETIDNPGWCVKIELSGTPLEDCVFFKKTDKKSFYDEWFDIRVEDKIYTAFGSNLSELVNTFYEEFLIPNLKISNFNYSVYTKVTNNEPFIWRELTTKMVDINTFQIIDIPDINWQNLKVEKVENFERVTFSEITTTLNWNIGDIVKCQLVEMYDYPTLIVIE